MNSEKDLLPDPKVHWGLLYSHVNLQNMHTHAWECKPQGTQWTKGGSPTGGLSFRQLFTFAHLSESKPQRTQWKEKDLTSVSEGSILQNCFPKGNDTTEQKIPCSYDFQV